MLRVSNISGFNRQWRPASTGLTLAGTGANNADAGDVSWTNPSNITASDNSDADADALGAGTSEYLHATNFSLSVATRTLVRGVIVRVERQGSATYVVDHTLQLIIGGSRSGDNNADTMTTWPTSDGTADYGGDTDHWGASLTPAVVNASNFGAALRTTMSTATQVRVDAIWINVHYIQ